MAQENMAAPKDNAMNSAAKPAPSPASNVSKPVAKPVAKMGEKKSPMMKDAKAKSVKKHNGFRKTTITHHSDGTHSVEHEHENHPKHSVSGSHADLNGVHQSLDANIGAAPSSANMGAGASAAMPEPPAPSAAPVAAAPPAAAMPPAAPAAPAMV